MGGRSLLEVQEGELYKYTRGSSSLETLLEDSILWKAAQGHPYY